MGIPFPAIEPADCAFTMPRHPVTGAISESGIEDHRLWGTVAVKGVLELEFRNIRTARANEILDTFRQSYSGILSLDLPEILFAGYTAEDRAFINSVTTGAGLRWYWPVGQDAPAPRQSLTFKHRCTLPVRLEARLQNEPVPSIPQPILWVSRLSTPIRGNTPNGGAMGSIVKGATQSSFQAFWFEAVGSTAEKVVVAKRDAQGVVLWTRWTSAEFGGQFTSRDSWCPQILAMSDGGCIVFASDDTIVTPFPHTYRLRAWRLSSNGSQVWSKEYVGRFLGAFKVAINGGEAVIYTAATFMAGGYNNYRTGLLRIEIASGSFIGGSSYQFDGTMETIPPSRSDGLIIQTTGAITLKAAQNVMMELNSNGSAVTRAARLTNLNGSIAALPSGGYVCRNGAETLVRIDSSFNVTASHRQINAMQSNGTFYGFDSMALAVSADGTCYHISDSFGNGEFFGVGVKIAAIANNGATPVGYGEIAYGSGTSEGQAQSSYSLRSGGVNEIDTVNKRGLLHYAGYGFSESSCRISAFGFSLELPTSTAANSTPSRTLYTGGCGNTMSLRGWDTLTYTNATPAAITRTVPVITVESVTATESAGAISMVDASSSLFWQTVRLDDGV
jgi:hypothetical protein